MTRNDRGLTLVELMVSMLLATILIGGLFYMMSGQERTYKNQMRTLTAQENLWGSMEFLQSEIRKAGMGFSGCAGEIRAALDGGGVVFDSGVPATTGFDALIVHNATNLFTGLADQTDSLSILYYDSSWAGGSGMGIRVTKEMKTHGNDLYVSAAGGLKEDDLVVICAPGAPWSTVIQLTKDPAKTPHDYDGDGNNDWRLAHNPALNNSASNWNPPPGHNIFPPDGYGAGATIVKIGNPLTEMYHYAIDNTRDPPMLVMWQGTNTAGRQVIAEGIEDMQISFTCDNGGAGGSDCGGACNASVAALGTPDDEFYEGAITDSNGDGSLNCADDDCSARLDEEWSNNAPLDVNPDCSAMPIRMVRVTLIARTSSPVLGDRMGFRPPAEDHTAGNPSLDLALTGNLGTYGRSMLTAKVKPRNIRASTETK